MSEKSRLPRRILTGVAAAVAALTVAVLVAPRFIPADFIAARVAGVVYQRTGGDLRVAGPIHLSLLPSLGVVANDVALRDDASGTLPNFLTVKTVEAELNPVALLRGSLEFSNVTLIQPVVDFDISKDGRRNWVFVRPPRPAAPTGPVTRTGGGTSFAAGDIVIKDGAISYSDQRGGMARGLSEVNVALSLPSLSGPVKTAGTAAFEGKQVQMALSLAAPDELLDGRASAAAVTISTAHGTFGFQGTIDGLEPLGAHGSVDFKTQSLRDLLLWTRTALVPRDDWLGPLAINGAVGLADMRISLRDASVSFDDIAAKGNFELIRADHQIELDLNDFALNGGSGTGKIVADTAGPSPVVTGNIELKGVTVHNMTFNIAGFDTLSGTGDVSADLTGAGGTMYEIVASLSGSGRIAFADGTIGSTALKPLIKNALGPLVNDKAVPRVIPYRTLSATAKIEQAMLRNNDLRLDGPQLSATGTGTLQLATREIDFSWQPDIHGVGSARIAITGAWDNPDYKLETLNIEKGKGLNLPGLKLR